MRTINILQFPDLFLFRRLMNKAALAGFALCLLSCGERIIDTEKTASVSNNDFILSLTISDEIVRLDDSIKLTAKIVRKIHKDSIEGIVSMKMIMDAVGGTIDGHSFSSASNITVSMDDNKGSEFQALAFFLPSYKYNSSKKEYYDYKEKGHVSVTFDGMSVSLVVSMVAPR